MSAGVARTGAAVPRRAALLACAPGGAGCATAKQNRAFYRDPDPTSGHPPDFSDRDEFMRPAADDR